MIHPIIIFKIFKTALFRNEIWKFYFNHKILFDFWSINIRWTNKYTLKLI